MTERGHRPSRAAKLARTLAVLLALAHLGVLAWLLGQRLVYPYDLEWMEGGMLCHALRLAEGQPLYAPPSLEFIPFLYTPLYPALVAALGKLVPGGIGYLLGRLVSIGSYLGATLLGWRFAARHGGSRAVATVALALPAAAFERTGAWYDIARPDSLWLLLATAGLLGLYGAARNDAGEQRRDGRAHLEAAGAAVLLVASFFAKQTSSPLLVAGGVALLVLNLRLVPVYGLTLAATGLPLLWWLNKSSNGWFWTYIFELHQSHAFYARRAFVETPWTLATIVGPALLLVPWALLRRRSPALGYASFLGLVGMIVACVAFGTQWAFINAYIPGVFFPAVALGVAGGLLVSPRRHGALMGHGLGGVTGGMAGGGTEGHWGWRSNLGDAPPRLRPIVVYGLLGLSLCLHHYDPRRYVPAPRDRAAGDQLIERLRDTPGEVLIPFHPFYAHLAGKRTYLHRMGVLDIAASRLGPPRGLAEAAREQRWRLAVFDDKVEGNWHLFPGLLDAYQIVERIQGPRVVTGAATAPTFVLMPRHRGRGAGTGGVGGTGGARTPEPAIDLELQ
jgi:hypothetical protein